MKQTWNWIISLLTFVLTNIYTIPTIYSIDEHSRGHTVVNTKKGIDRFGKISDELMNQVFLPQWQEERFIYRPGIQAGYFQIPIQLYFDKGSFDLVQADELNFNQTGISKDKKSILGSVAADKLLMVNNIPGILAAELPGHHHVQLAQSPAPFIVKRTNSEALQKAGIPEIWSRLGKGKGVKIGIIDGGFINLHTLIESGILPKDQVHLRTVLPEKLALQHPLGSANVHGTAVVEIIHEIAPEAELYLYPTLLQTSAWEKAVLMAIEDGVHIINSSLNSTYGALDNLGDPNSFIQPAIQAGIVYVNSAGNNGESCYISSFMDLDRNGWHNFTVEDEGNSIFLNKGENFSATLTWDDYGSNPNFPNSTQDLDLYLFYVDPNTHQTIQVAQSQNVQSEINPKLNSPMETVGFSQEGAPHTGVYTIMIRAHEIDQNRKLDLRLIITAFDSINPPPNIFKRLQYTSRQMTMTKPADDPGVITVAACGIDENIHSYSGTGPTESGILKPDITGYSGLLTSSFEKPFYGTSCASPFVAGCAALLWQQYPNAVQVKEELLKRVKKPTLIGVQSHDANAGYGIVNLSELNRLQPKYDIVSVSRMNDSSSGEITGFNIEILFTCQDAGGKQVFTSLYFLTPDGKPIQAPDDYEVYQGKNGELRVASYLVPSNNKQSAFRSWLFIPNVVAKAAGEDAIVGIRLETSDYETVSSVSFSTLKDL